MSLFSCMVIESDDVRWEGWKEGGYFGNFWQC